MTIFEEVPTDHHDRDVDGCTAVLLSAQCTVLVMREKCSDTAPQTLLIEINHKDQTWEYRVDAGKAIDLAEALARQALDIPASIPFDWKPWPEER